MEAKKPHTAAHKSHSFSLSWGSKNFLANTKKKVTTFAITQRLSNIGLALARSSPRVIKPQRQKAKELHLANVPLAKRKKGELWLMSHSILSPPCWRSFLIIKDPWQMSPLPSEIISLRAAAFQGQFCLRLQSINPSLPPLSSFDSVTFLCQAEEGNKRQYYKWSAAQCSIYSYDKCMTFSSEFILLQ